MTYRPRLDAFRGCCIAAVFLAHTGALDCGWIGVQAFFVLSGFLITESLLESLDGEPGPRAYFLGFYARRVLRIFPAYLAYILLPPLVCGLFDSPASDLVLYNFWQHAPYLLTFTENFHRLADLFNNALYSHLWSLSIEEQFYLLWPLLLFFLPASRRVALCLALVAAGPVIRGLEVALQLHAGPLVPPAPGRFVYFFTPSHFDAFAIGALLFCARDHAGVNAFVRRYGKWVLAAPVLTGLWMLALGRLARYDMGLSSLGWPTYLSRFGACIWGYSLLNAAFFVCLARIDSAPRFLDARPLQRLGRISYGFYIFHLPIIFLTNLLLFERALPLGVPNLLCGVVAFLATWLVSELSFRAMEAPLLRLKSRLRFARPMPQAAGAAS